MKSASREVACFLPEPPETVLKNRKSGTFYQEETLLGWMLNPNSIDHYELPQLSELPRI